MTFIRQQRRARSTGHLVTLFDTAAPENVFDSNGGRWVTVCETHHTLCNHEKLRLAQSFAATPEQWCEDCQRELEKR